MISEIVLILSPVRNRSSMCRVIFLLFFCATLTELSGQSQDFVILKDLGDEWLVFEKKRDRFVPYIPGRSGKLRTIHIPLTQRFEGADLYLELPARTSVYINDKPWAYEKDNYVRQWDLDSIFTAYHPESVRLAIYAERLDPEKVVTQVVTPNRVSTTVDAIEKRKTNPAFNNFLVVGILLVLFLLALLLRLYPKSLPVFFDLAQAIAPRDREEIILRSKPLSKVNLQILFFHSLMVAFVFLLLNENSGGLFNQAKEWQFDKFHIGFWRWIKAFAFVLLFFGIKLISVQLFSLLYRIRSFFNTHFNNYLRLSVIITWIGWGLFLFFYYVMEYRNPTPYITLVYLLLGLMILRILVIFIKLRNVSTHRNLHLFSYLCATEIIPYTVSFKFLVL